MRENTDNNEKAGRNSYADSNGSDFPMECVKHLASCSCGCQTSGPDVSKNRHVNSCMVGKAQAFLGHKVTEKKLYGGYFG